MTSLSANRPARAAVPRAWSTCATRGVWPGRRLRPSCAGSVGRRPRRLGQPGSGARAQRQERGFLRGMSSGRPFVGVGPAGLRRVVLVHDGRVARSGPRVPGDHDRTAGGHGSDDQFVAMEAGRYPGVDQIVRDGVTDASTEMVQSQLTRRVVPNATVNGCAAAGAAGPLPGPGPRLGDGGSRGGSAD